ncbi:alpha/beta fold hydrolase [Cellulomonas sp. Marseille-Q8402]
MPDPARVAGLHVEVRGSGPTVVLLHGNGEDSASLAPVAALLADDFRVLSVDARGHGRSPRGDGPLTIARMADDVAAVLVGDVGGDGEPVAVVGYSDGGNVALMLALRHPEAVRALVVYGANTVPAGLTARVRAEVTAQWLRERAQGITDPAMRARAEITDLMVHQPRIPLRALARIAVPVLVAAGEHDVVRRTHTEAIAAHLPAGECVLVPGADHGLPVSDPAAFAGRVREFLAAV